MWHHLIFVHNFIQFLLSCIWLADFTKACSACLSQIAQLQAEYDGSVAEKDHLTKNIAQTATSI